MKVTYTGPSAAVIICATGARVACGESVEVDQTLGKQLVAQGWERSKPAANKKAAPRKAAANKKAATPAAADPSEED